MDPGYVDAWLNIASVLADDERFEEALSVMNRAIELKPDRADTYNNMGAHLTKMGKPIVMCLVLLVVQSCIRAKLFGGSKCITFYLTTGRFKVVPTFTDCVVPLKFLLKNVANKLKLVGGVDVTL